ncbi:oligosaccharide flippase family protein, partial [Jannaschia sp.]|nr:oligosaccharide flippase family protein [Jannaschia sp.]
MKTSKALLWTGSQFVAVTAVEIAGLVILSRVLTPQQMGVAAAAYAALRIFALMANFGMHPVIVRAPTLDLDLRRQIIGLAVMLSIGSFAVLSTAMTLMPDAWIAGDLRAVLWVMAPGLLVAGFTMTGSALLVREQRFPTLFKLRLGATVASQGVAVCLALAGAGPMALAVGYLAGAFAFALGATVASGGRFLVSPQWRVGGTLLRAAGALFALNVVGQARQATPALLLGPLAGFAAVGQYTRAADLVEQGTRILREVAFTVLTPKIFEAARKGADPAQAYLPAATRLATVVWPLALMLSILAEPVVGLLLGDQWQAAIAPLSLLALGLLAMPL